VRTAAAGNHADRKAERAVPGNGQQSPGRQRNAVHIRNKVPPAGIDDVFPVAKRDAPDAPPLIAASDQRRKLQDGFVRLADENDVDLRKGAERFFDREGHVGSAHHCEQIRIDAFGVAQNALRVVKVHGDGARAHRIGAKLRELPGQLFLGVAGNDVVENPDLGAGRFESGGHVGNAERRRGVFFQRIGSGNNRNAHFNLLCAGKGSIGSTRKVSFFPA